MPDPAALGSGNHDLRGTSATSCLDMALTAGGYASRASWTGSLAPPESERVRSEWGSCDVPADASELGGYVDIRGNANQLNLPVSASLTAGSGSAINIPPFSPKHAPQLLHPSSQQQQQAQALPPQPQQPQDPVHDQQALQHVQSDISEKPSDCLRSMRFVASFSAPTANAAAASAAGANAGAGASAGGAPSPSGSAGANALATRLPEP